MYTFDESIVSDLHKDARGYRPRETFWTIWEDSKNDQKQEIWNELVLELEESNRQEALREEAAVTAFAKRISDAIALGAKNEETAIRWVLEGENFDLNDYQYGADYAAYHFGLSYRNQWRDTIDRITHQKVCELCEELA